MSQDNTILGKILIFALGAIISIFCLMSYSIPSYQASIDGRTAKPFELDRLSEGTHRIDIYLQELPAKFHFVVFDCLESLMVNNLAIENFGFPYCDRGRQAEIPLDNIPPKASNTITAVIRNGSGLGIFKPFYDPFAYFQPNRKLLFAIGIFLIFISIIPQSEAEYYFLPLLFGMGFRTAVSNIPIEFRGADFPGHLDYLQFVYQNWRIPSISQCWQCYQPPVFYFLCAGLSKFLGFDPGDLGTLGLFPLLLSFLGVFLSISLYRLWLPNIKSTLPLIPFLILPGVVYSEIAFNNDSLSSLLSILILLIGTHYYRNSSKKLIVPGSLFVAVGLINKLSIAPAATWWFLLLGIHKYHPRESAKRLLQATCLVMLIVGPYFFYRLNTEKFLQPIGNIDGLDKRLSVESNLENFTVFNPISMIREPFIDPWNDGLHRDNFWEYLFLNSLFLDYQYKLKSLGRVAVGILLCSIFISLIYLLFDCIKREQSSLLIAGGVLLFILLLVLNRLIYPFASQNNFRFISASAILIAILLQQQFKNTKAAAFTALLNWCGVLLTWWVIFNGAVEI